MRLFAPKCLTVMAILLLRVGGAQGAAEGELFGLGKVHEFHLELTAKEWATLQQVKGGTMFGFGGAKKAEEPAEKPADVHKGGSFALEFPWAHASFSAEGRTLKDVGVRYKGGGSYLSSAGNLRKNFKVEFDRYDKKGAFHGKTTLSLNSGAADPTRGREALAFAVYRAAGVAAPRTAYAEVTLTVPGKYDKELLGMYTVVEQVDKAFLKEHFKNGNGLVLKPEGSAGGRWRLFEYKGDDWEAYQVITGPRREASKKEAKRLIDFTRLIHQADDATFRKQVGDYLDVDQFLRFFACTAYVANMDSVFTTSHNVYIYLNPANNKFVLLPWDVDLAFAGFPLMGTPEKLMNLSLLHPYPGEIKLVDRLLADETIAARYRQIFKELAATCFSKEKLLRDIATIEAAAKPLLEREGKAAAARKEKTAGPGLMGPGMFGKTPDLRTFVDKRNQSVALQLDGKAKGFIPASLGFFIPDTKGKGGKGPLGFDPATFKIGNMMGPPLINALDADEDGKLSRDEWIGMAKKIVAAGEKDAQGRVSEKALAAAINGMLPKATPGTPNPFGFFSLGNFLAGPIVKKADADNDGLVTQDEIVRAAGKFFDDFDKSRQGTMDELRFSDMLTAIFPPLPFGQPAPKPEAPKKEEKKGSSP